MGDNKVYTVVGSRSIIITNNITKSIHFSSGAKAFHPESNEVKFYFQITPL